MLQYLHVFRWYGCGSRGIFHLHICGAKQKKAPFFCEMTIAPTYICLIIVADNIYLGVGAKQ